MSLANAKEFLQRIQNDPAFKQRLVDAPGAGARAELVAREGYEFTTGELRQLRDELTEDQLANISGGTVCAFSNHDTFGFWPI